MGQEPWRVLRRGVLKELKTLSIKQIGREEPRQLRRKAVCEIIEARMDELFYLIHNEIKKSGNDGKLSGGIVITGGACKLPGVSDSASKAMRLPVRLASPRNILGLSNEVNGPMYSCAVGLAQYGARDREDARGQNRGQNLWQNLWGWAKKFGTN